MVKRKRYQGEFLSRAGVKWRVEIWQDQEKAFPTVGELTFPAESPLEIEWTETDKLEPVQSSKATLTIVSKQDRQYKDLYTVEVGSIRMDVYREDKLYWSGTLDTELYEEPYSFKQEYEVTLTFSDFAILDRISYESTTDRTLKDIIQSCVDASYIHYNTIKEYISTRLENGNNNNSLLEQLIISSGNWYDEDWIPMTLREVLEETLRPFGLRLIQRAGGIHLYDLNQIYISNQLQIVEWTGTDAILSVDKIYNNIDLTFSPYDKIDLFQQEVVVDDFKVRQTSNWSTDFSNSDTTENGFNLALYTLEQDLPEVTLHNKCKPFYLESISSGQDATGIAWKVWNVNLKTKELYPILNNELHSSSIFGQSLMRINKKIILPRVYNKSSSIGRSPDVSTYNFEGFSKSNRVSDDYQLNINMEVLLDYRYNPFEDRDSNFKEKYNKARSFFYGYAIPFRLRVKNDEGVTIAHYVNLDSEDKYPQPQKIISGKWYSGEYQEEEKSVLCYYNPTSAVFGNYEHGWQENYSSEYKGKKAKGEFIDIPNDISGHLELEILTGVFYMVGAFIVNQWMYMDFMGEYKISTVEFLEKNMLWTLYKLPVIKISKHDGEEIKSEDVDYSAWLHKSAREGLELETYVGTGGNKINRGYGLLTTTSDLNKATHFNRAGITNCLEELLLNTIYSNYSRRMNVLSGTVKLLDGFNIYTDSQEPVKYLLASDKQNVIEDESEIKMIEFSADEYREKLS